MRTCTAAFLYSMALMRSRMDCSTYSISCELMYTTIFCMSCTIFMAKNLIPELMYTVTLELYYSN